MPKLDILNRLESSGLRIVDLRGSLPRNGTAKTRSVSAIKKITIHYDAIALTDGYDSQARQSSIARGHINRNWGTATSPIKGSGIMYCFTIDAYGTVFYNRDLDEVLWHAGATGVDNNTSALSIMLHGSTPDRPNKENTRALGILLDVLTTKCPEFPAGRSDVYGHKEMPNCRTACPGNYMELVTAYRENRYPSSISNQDDMTGITPIEQAFKSGDDLFVTVKLDDKSKISNFGLSEDRAISIIYTEGLQTGDVYAPTASYNAHNLLALMNTAKEQKVALESSVSSLEVSLVSKEQLNRDLMMEISRLNDEIKKPQEITLELALRKVVRFITQAIRKS
jgi:hypothetical protein